MQDQFDRRTTRPVSQVEVETKILDDLDAMEDITHELRDILEAEAKADAEYKKQRAIAYTRGHGSIKDKEFQADRQCAELYEEHLLTKARAKATATALRTIQTRVEAMRSLNSNLRHQV